jgi:hypothetical protein
VSAPNHESGPATGRDAREAVTVVLADDGLPKSMEISQDWRRLVGAEGFAAAVTEASEKAAEARLTASTADTPPWTGPVTAPPNPPPVSRSMHFTSWMIDDVIRAFEATKGLAERNRRGITLTASAALGQLTLTEGTIGNLVCEADSGWVGQQNTESLTAALATAVASLRAERGERADLRDTALSALMRLYG